MPSGFGGPALRQVNPQNLGNPEAGVMDDGADVVVRVRVGFVGRCMDEVQKFGNFIDVVVGHCLFPPLNYYYL